MSDTHTNVTPGVRGQTRSTWRDETHLRGILMRLISENKDASREEIEAMYIAKCEMVPKLIEEALRRSFDNDWKQFQKPTVARRPVRTEEEIAATKAEIAAAVERVKEIALLEWAMPNGKTFGDCTGQEVQQFGSKVAPWLAKVVSKVKPDERVRDVLSETDVRKMWGK
jgi:hypothetical protein